MTKDKLIKELELGLKNPNVPDTFKDKIRIKLAALKSEEPKETSSKKTAKPKPSPKQPSKPKFKVGDVVANINKKTIGIVRDVYLSEGEVKTDADGNVSISELEIYNSKKHKDYKTAPSTKKEIENELSVIEILYDADSKGWNATKADSGSEIRNSEELTKKYAEAVKKALTEHGIKKGSLIEADYDILVDDNYHLLNEFLAWNRYYDNATGKMLQEMYQRIYDRGTNSAADPEAMSLEPTYKPTKKKATPIKKATNRYIANREIKSVTILEDGKKVTYSGKDVLNGANFFEKGGKLSDKAKYIVKANIVNVEFADGSVEKPENGYHIKNGAKPIMQHGGQVTLPQGSLQSYQNYYLEHGGVADDVIVLAPLQLKNLSSQLMKHTGEPYTSDYVAEDGSTRLPAPGKLLIHKPTGKKFLMPRILYNRISGYNLVYDKKNKEIVTYEDGKVVAEVVKGKLNFAFKDPSISIRKIEVEKEFENGNIPLLMETDDEMYKLGGALLSAWKRERKYVNKKEDYEVRYAKDKNRSGYKKFADGGEIENDKFEKVVYLPNENKFVKIKIEHNPIFDRYIYSVDGSVVSEHKTIDEAVAEADNEGLVNYPSKDSVVGNISTGKPIFENRQANDKAYSHFTKKDHELAGKLWMSNKIDNKTKLNMTERDELSADHFRKARILTKEEKFEKGGVLKVGDKFTGNPNGSFNEDWELYEQRFSYVLDENNNILSVHKTPLEAIKERAKTFNNNKVHFEPLKKIEKEGEFFDYSQKYDSEKIKTYKDVVDFYKYLHKQNIVFHVDDALEDEILDKYSEDAINISEKEGFDIYFLYLSLNQEENLKIGSLLVDDRYMHNEDRFYKVIKSTKEGIELNVWEHGKPNGSWSTSPKNLTGLRAATEEEERIYEDEVSEWEERNNTKYEKGGVLKVGDEVVDFKTGEYRGKVAEVLEINADEDDIVIENKNGVLLTENSSNLLKKPNIKANLGATPKEKLSIEELKAKHGVSNYGKGGKTEGKGKGAIFETAKKIRKPGEKWQDAVKRASQLK